MRRLAKNLILATATVSAIFLVDLSHVEAITQEKICPHENSIQHLDFWTKFRDTVMPDPDEPQDNNPPKEEAPPPQEEPPKRTAPPKQEDPPKRAEAPKPVD